MPRNHRDRGGTVAWLGVTIALSVSLLALSSCLLSSSGWAGLSRGIEHRKEADVDVDARLAVEAAAAMTRRRTGPGQLPLVQYIQY